MRHLSEPDAQRSSSGNCTGLIAQFPWNGLDGISLILGCLRKDRIRPSHNLGCLLYAGLICLCAYKHLLDLFQQLLLERFKNVVIPIGADRL